MNASPIREHGQAVSFLWKKPTVIMKREHAPTHSQCESAGMVNTYTLQKLIYHVPTCCSASLFWISWSSQTSYTTGLESSDSIRANQVRRLLMFLSNCWINAKVSFSFFTLNICAGKKRGGNKSAMFSGENAPIRVVLGKMQPTLVIDFIGGTTLSRYEFSQNRWHLTKLLFWMIFKWTKS